MFPRPHVRARFGVLACMLACAGEPDPLDSELIRELSAADGSAVGNLHTGLWHFEYELESCDCPSVELEGQTSDLCELVTLVPTELPISHTDGRLGIMIGSLTSTGAIESDGSFVVAMLHDLSGVLLSLEAVSRFDGQFDADSTHAEGTFAQRMFGELAGEPLDCRQTSTFVATRS